MLLIITYYSSFSLVFCYNISLSLFTGTIEHETIGFIRRDAVNSARERRGYQVLFYDTNPSSNVIAICRRFLSGLRHNSRLYSDALHPHFNQDGRCGHLSFLEIFLSFHMHTSPFQRLETLNTRPLTGNRNDGYQGPRMGSPSNRRSGRNRNIPRNQSR